MQATRAAILDSAHDARTPRWRARERRAGGRIGADHDTSLLVPATTTHHAREGGRMGGGHIVMIIALVDNERTTCDCMQKKIEKKRLSC